MLRKIPRTQLRAFAVQQLKAQGGCCAICKQPIDMAVRGAKSEYVVDHDHISGEVRGVLCRGCNGAEGKVTRAVACWAKAGMDYAKVSEWLRAMLTYLDQPGLGAMYPGHKTAEERAAAAKVKRRSAAAERRAKLKMQKPKVE